MNWIFFQLLNVNNFVGWTPFFFHFSRYDAIVYDFLMFGILIKWNKKCFYCILMKFSVTFFQIEFKVRIRLDDDLLKKKCLTNSPKITP